MMTWQESVAWRPEIEGHSLDILPFFTAIEHRIPKGGVYVEVGVYKGRSFRFMRELRPDLHMIAIDPWTDESVSASLGTGDETFDTFMRNMSGAHQWVAERTTFSADRFTLKVDMTFIDGDHNYPGVSSDIAEAKLIVKPGGIISGHDYAGDNGVCQAVREAFPGRYQLSDWDGPVLPGAPEGKGRCWWVVV